MKKIIAETLLTGLESVSSTVYDDLKKENGKIKNIFMSIIRIPIKVIATFLFSPLILALILIDVRKKNRISTIKFIIVVIGFIFAIIASYLVSERKGFFNNEGQKIMKKRLIEKFFVFQLHRSDIYVAQCVSVG